MLKKISILIFICSTAWVHAQKEANIWYFGTKAGFDFTNGTAVLLQDGAIDNLEASASICDKNGNLLFYTDAQTVYDKDHNIMPNGSGLLGHYSTAQCLIAPHPGNSNLFYVFSLNYVISTQGLRYSVVDMTLNNGKGDVTDKKNVLLHTTTSERITAVEHANGEDIWVITHDLYSNEFISFLITDSGINTTPIVQAIGNTLPDSGCLKVSANGKKLAVTSYAANRLEIYDYDDATGMLSNLISLDDIDDYWGDAYGIEFSPNSQLLYLSTWGWRSGVFQMDLSYSDPLDIENSKVRITKNDPDYWGHVYGQLQIAPDGKIYNAQQRTTMAVIHQPDIKGDGCMYDWSIYFDFGNTGAISRMGLPQFVQSFFKVGVFDHDNTCFGDTTTFKLDDTVDTILWDFGDPASGLNNTSTTFEPSHVFSAPGTYTITVTATANGETDTSQQEITIYELPVATRPIGMVVCDDNNDGFYNFNLQQRDTEILNGLDPSVFEVRYYASAADYTSNTPIANPSNYSNRLAYAQETIVAAVVNRSNPTCDDITSFNIQVFESPKPSQSISNLSYCDNTSVGSDTDGVIQFDLTEKETDILNGQSASNFNIEYFTDATFLNNITDPSQYENSNTTETIYVKVTNVANTLCVENTSFEIEVLQLPVVNETVDLKQCDDDLDGFSVFNLNEVISKISTNANNEIITFYETLADAETGSVNDIQNIDKYTNQNVSIDRIWVRVENNNQCYRTVEVNLIVSTTQIPISFTRDFYKCDDDLDGDITNGISVFDFSMVNSEIESLFPVGQQLIISYYQTKEDALAETNAITDISNYRNVNSPMTQNIYVRVDSALDNDCLALGAHITLHVEQQPVAYQISIPEQCDDDGDGMFAFDTSNIETAILNGQTGMAVTYIDGLGNNLPSPLPNPFLTATQTITATVTNTNSQDSDGACSDETTIEFRVDAASVAYPIADLIECDIDNDGQVAFDTANIESTVLNGQSGMLVSYTDENDNQLPSPLPNPFLSSSQTITVRVENPLSNICYDETTFNLVVIEQPVLNMSDTWLICEGDFVDIIADEGYDTYLWSTGDNTNVARVFSAGTYEVTATNMYDGISCETIKTITVIESNIATITNIETEDWTQNDNVISIFVDGDGDYEYSIDGDIYQDQNTFGNLKIGDYTVYVRDKNGCGVNSQDVFLMFYPKFFTPNNDGFHDTWHIYNASLEPDNKIYIYDRYGKLLKQLSPNNSGWDGTINGELMPTEDYWFVVYRENGKQYRGHFTLKR